MTLFKKFITLVGKGPTVVATAGIIGTSVSLPDVIDSVGPKCLTMIDSVLTGWTRRSRGGRSATDEETKFWGILSEIKDEDTSKYYGEYPCWALTQTYGGIYGPWARRDSNGSTGDSEIDSSVERICPPKLQEESIKYVKEFWKETKKQHSSIKNEIEEIENNLKHIDKKSPPNKIREIAKQVNETFQKVLKKSDDYSKLMKWISEEWHNKNDKWKQFFGRWNEEFEKKVLKTIDLKKIKNKTIKNLLETNPKYCAATER